ncbi:MAG: hypothetical protein KatS3mg051_0835 [Anaerolineae bacterium]|nr:MAG: hypothetical protein KatS3mg051_0835 [Anaerolineae bacterium]
MTVRMRPLLWLLCLLTLAAVALPLRVWAQTGERYENPSLGVSFTMPAGWQVNAWEKGLLAGAPADLALVEAGTMPQGLVVRMVFGSFSELGITDASQLPDLLTRLIAESPTVPEPRRIEWGNASGYEELVTLPQEQLTTRVALLAVAGGRVAIVRGMAPAAAWDTGAGAQFDALAASLFFTLPAREADLMTRLTTNDGGVLWHYVAPQPESRRMVRAGGIVYDMFNVMYMAAGPGGVLSLEMNSGRQISYMGPWVGGDYVDVAIGPDTKLYLANVAEERQAAVTVVDRAGNFARAWGARGDGDGEFAPGMPQTIAVTRGGDVWTVSEGHSAGIRNRLYKFDAFGNLLLTADLSAINPDLSGVRLAVNDRTDALYLVGATGSLNVVDSQGEPLVVNLAQEILQGLTPLDIAIAPNDNLILALPAPGLDGFGFLEMSVAGKLLDAFGFPYDATRGGPFLPGEYFRPAGLVVGPDGTIYWTETHPETGYTQVQRFTFTGDGLLPLGAEVAAGSGGESPLGADPAQGGGPLAYGQAVRGALNNRYPLHRWTFEGSAGDHVLITMKDVSGAGLLDPQLRLLNAEGRAIAANDDVGAVRPEGLAERDAVIDFFLPATGTYTIEAGRFGGRGDYLLTLERLAQ